MKFISENFDYTRIFLWIPFFIGSGIFVYFELTFEPNLFFIIILNIFSFSILLIFLFFKKIFNNFFYIFFLFLSVTFFSFSIGFSAAKIRTFFCPTKFINFDCKNIVLSGNVLEFEEVPRGNLGLKKINYMQKRITISNIKILDQNFKKENFFNSSKIKIRLTSRSSKITGFSVGDKISFFCDIESPKDSVSSAGYNLKFDLFFRKISAVGKIKKITEIEKIDKKNIILSKFSEIKNFINEGINKSLSKENAPLIRSIITGSRSGISLKNKENFINAGLAHLLAISGLHMSILSLVIFFIFKNFFTIFKIFGIKIQSKKISAIITIPITFFYLIISGSSFSAIRSFIMITICMIGLIFDLKALSIFSVAFAAIIILIIFPESLFSASFQLSFSAVTGLSGFFEKIHPPYFSKKSQNFNNFLINKTIDLLNNFNLISKKFLNAILQNLYSTFVATIATTPITVYVFNRITLVSFLSNMFLIPFFSFIVLPFSFFSIFFIHSDSELSFLIFKSLDKIFILFSKFVSFFSSLPFSKINVYRPHFFVLFSIIFGFYFWIVSSKKISIFGIISIIFGLTFFLIDSPPDIYISKFGNAIGVQKKIKNGIKNKRKKFYISDLREHNFNGKVWSSECGIDSFEKLGRKEFFNIIGSLNFKKHLKYESDLMMIWLKNDEIKNGNFNLPKNIKKIKIFSPKLKKRPWS